MSVSKRVFCLFFKRTILMKFRFYSLLILLSFIFLFLPFFHFSTVLADFWEIPTGSDPNNPDNAIFVPNDQIQLSCGGCTGWQPVEPGNAPFSSYCISHCFEPNPGKEIRDPVTGAIIGYACNATIGFCANGCGSREDCSAKGYSEQSCINAGCSVQHDCTCTKSCGPDCDYQVNDCSVCPERYTGCGGFGPCQLDCYRWNNDPGGCANNNCQWLGSDFSTKCIATFSTTCPANQCSCGNPCGDTIACTPSGGTCNQPTPTPTPAPVSISSRAVTISPNDDCIAVRASTNGLSGTVHSFTVAPTPSPAPATQTGAGYVSFPSSPAGTYTLSVSNIPADFVLARACWQTTNPVSSGEGLSVALSGGEALQWDIGYSAGSAWVQTEAGNVYSAGILKSFIPAGTIPRYFNLDAPTLP